MIKQSKIDNMIAEYRQSGNQAATARKYEVSINTLKKYIHEYQSDSSIDKKEYLEAEIVTDNPPANIYNINNKDNINNINKDINIKNIDNDINIVSNTDSTSKNNNKAFNTAKTIKSIQSALDLALKRYKTEYKNVHPNYISKDIGIFTDKLLRLTGEGGLGPDIKQIIFNNFGSNKDMLELITQIQLSKNKLPG